MSNVEPLAVCAACGRSYAYWGKHMRQWGCAWPEPARAQKADSTLALDLRFMELQNRLGVTVATLHLHQNMSITACVSAVQLAEEATAHVIETMRAAAASAAASSTVLAAADITAIGARSAALLQGLRKIPEVCEKHATGALTPVERPLLAQAKASKKHFAFFSLVHEIADILQNNPEDRNHCYTSTEEWSTGKLRLPQSKITDVIHGQRFRDSPASRPFTPAERAGLRRVHIAAQAWNDDATVRVPRVCIVAAG
jgi:hypothetical protein